MQTPKRSLKDKVKIAKAVIKTVFKPKSKEEKLKSKSSKKDWNKEQAAIKNEFGDYKKGGVVKKQNGGNAGFNTIAKKVKNTEWQKAPVTRTPFSVVPKDIEISERKPKVNWVSPPSTSSSSEPVIRSPYDRIVPEKKKGGATNKNWIQDATASIKRRGTAGKCTPITKPGCTGKAKALAKTFKKIAKKK
jgi:hypothetical protein